MIDDFAIFPIFPFVTILNKYFANMIKAAIISFKKIVCCFTHRILFKLPKISNWTKNWNDFISIWRKRTRFVAVEWASRWFVKGSVSSVSFNFRKNILLIVNPTQIWECSFINKLWGKYLPVQSHGCCICDKTANNHIEGLTLATAKRRNERHCLLLSMKLFLPHDY